MRPWDRAWLLRWAGILLGLALVVLGFDLPGSPEFGLLVALLGVGLILLVALSGTGRLSRGDPGSPRRPAEGRTQTPSGTPHDAGRRM